VPATEDFLLVRDHPDISFGLILVEPHLGHPNQFPQMTGPAQAMVNIVIAIHGLEVNPPN